MASLDVVINDKTGEATRVIKRNIEEIKESSSSLKTATQDGTKVIKRSLEDMAASSNAALSSMQSMLKSTKNLLLSFIKNKNDSKEI